MNGFKNLAGPILQRYGVKRVGVSLNKVWGVVQRDLIDLKNKLERLLHELEQ